MADSTGTVLDSLLVEIGFRVKSDAIKKIPKDSKESAEKTKKHWTEAALKITEEFGKAADAIAKVMAGAAAAVAGLAASVYKLADDAGKRAAKLVADAETIGVSTTTLQEYEYILKQLGRRPESFTKGMLAFNKFFVDAMQKGVGAVAESAHILGIELEALSGKTNMEALDAIREKFVTLGETERNAVAAKLFEKEYGADMTAVLSLTADEFARLRYEAQETGNVLEEELLKKAAEQRAELEKYKGALENIKIELGVELLPLVIKAVRHFSEWASKNKEAIKGELLSRLSKLIQLFKELSPIFEFVLDNWKTLLGIWSGVKLASAIGAVAGGIATITTSVKDLSLAMLTNPFTLIVAGLAAALPLAWKLGDALGEIQAQADGYGKGPTTDKAGAIGMWKDNEAFNKENARRKKKGLPTFTKMKDFKAYQAKRAEMIEDYSGGGVEMTPEAIEAANRAARLAEERAAREKEERAKKAEEARKKKQRAEDEKLFFKRLDRARQIAGLRQEALAAAMKPTVDFYQRGGADAPSIEKGYGVLEELGGIDKGMLSRRMAIEGKYLDEEVNDARAPHRLLTDVTQGHAPRVVVSNVYNTFNFRNDFSISGAASPRTVAEEIVGAQQNQLRNEIEQATNTVKPIFVR